MAFVQIGRNKKKDKLVRMKVYKNLIRNNQGGILNLHKKVVPFFKNLFKKKNK